MTSPRALVLSIVATWSVFILAIVAAAGQASTAPTPAVGAAMAPSTVSAVAEDVGHVDPVTYTVAL